MSDYAAMISEVADLARRIGPARTPEDIRDRLEDIVARHRRREEAARQPGPAIASENRAVTQELRERYNRLRELAEHYATREAIPGVLISQDVYAGRLAAKDIEGVLAELAASRADVARLLAASKDALDLIDGQRLFRDRERADLKARLVAALAEHEAGKGGG